MRIYPKILVATLPLLLGGILAVGGLSYQASRYALTTLAEEWLETKLGDGVRVLREDEAVLRRYGLEAAPPNVAKAKAHAARELLAIPFGRGGHFAVVDDQGLVVVHPAPHRVGSDVSATDWFRQLQDTDQGPKSFTWEGEDLLAVHERFAPWGWYLVAGAPQAEVFGPVERMKARLAALAALAALLAAAVLVVLARRLSAPLGALVLEANRIGGGDLRPVRGAGGADEIRALGAAFDAMTARLKRRIELETLVSDLSRRFIDLPPDGVDAAIDQALAAIGAHVGVERVRVFAFSEGDQAMIRMTHEWRSPAGAFPEDEGRAYDQASYPWLLGKMRALETVHAPDLAALPPEAGVDVASWRARGVGSLLRVPMSCRSHLWGYIGFDAVGGRKEWSAEDIRLLQVVGEIFCQTLGRKASEAALAAERERLAVTLRSIGDGVITTDTEGRVVLVNRVAEALTGWTQAEAAGLPLPQVFRVLDEKTRQLCESPVATVLRSGRGVSLTTHAALVARDGTERVIADSGAPILDTEGRVVGVVLVFRDVTERRRLEEEMLKAEKLRSVGVLAGGIAHDFNNLLTGILGNASLARLRLGQDHPVARKLEAIEKASERAADLTRQLLTFSRGGAPVTAPRQLAELIVESAEFSLRGSRARCAFSIPSDLWPAEVDAGQISQVIGNLVLNADQAMPEGGTIRVTAENLRIDEGTEGPLAPGRYLRLSVADEGVGIPAEDLPRVFDPYFTTKAEGSGLGLATAHSVVRQHRGRIEVRSQVGGGTTVSVVLPACERAASEVRGAGGALPRGQGKILVMDDQEVVREVAAGMLKAGGYAVGFARDGEELLAAHRSAREAGTPYDAVLMDLTVPGGMGGKEAMARLREEDPGVVAIVASGYSHDPVMANHRAYGFRAVVTKPFGTRTLLEAVSSALAGG